MHLNYEDFLKGQCAHCSQTLKRKDERITKIKRQPPQCDDEYFQPPHSSGREITNFEVICLIYGISHNTLAEILVQSFKNPKEEEQDEVILSTEKNQNDKMCSAVAIRQNLFFCHQCGLLFTEMFQMIGKFRNLSDKNSLLSLTLHKQFCSINEALKCQENENDSEIKMENIDFENEHSENPFLMDKSTIKNMESSFPVVKEEYISENVSTDIDNDQLNIFEETIVMEDRLLADAVSSPENNQHRQQKRKPKLKEAKIVLERLPENITRMSENKLMIATSSRTKGYYSLREKADGIKKFVNVSDDDLNATDGEWSCSEKAKSESDLQESNHPVKKSKGSKSKKRAISGEMKVIHTKKIRSSDAKPYFSIPIKTKMNVPQKYNYICKECGIRFSIIGNMRCHLTTHAKDSNMEIHSETINGPPYHCPKCNKSLGSQNSLSMHCIRFHNLKVKSAKNGKQKSSHDCLKCGLTFEGIRALYTHNRHMHTTKMYMCEPCDKGFLLQTEWLTHKQEIHRHRWKSFEAEESKDRDDNESRKEICDEPCSYNIKAPNHSHQFDSIDNDEEFKNSVSPLVDLEGSSAEKGRVHEHWSPRKKDDQINKIENVSDDHFDGPGDEKSSLIQEPISESELNQQESNRPGTKNYISYEKTPFLKTSKASKINKPAISGEVKVIQTKKIRSADAKPYFSIPIKTKMNVPQKYNYICKECGIRFSIIGNMRCHLTTHAKDSNMEIHPETINGPPYNCPKCDKSLGSQNSLSSHCLRFHNLKVKSTKHGKEEKSSHECLKCGLTFKGIRALYTHNRHMHTTKMYMCEPCDKGFLLETEWLCHRQLVHRIRGKIFKIEQPKGSDNDRGEGFFEGPECQSHKQEIPPHSVERLGEHSKDCNYEGGKEICEEPFFCRECGFSFKNSLAICVHNLKSNHFSSKQFDCRFCEETFKNAVSLLHHLSSAHKVYASPELYKDNFCCTDCENGEIFESYECLQIHFQQSNHCSFKMTCDLCDKSFPNINLFIRHNRLNHPQKFYGRNLPLECAFCGEKFSSAQKRRAHEKTHPKEEQLYKCPQCPKTYTNTNSLNYHTQTIHSEIFQCNECGKTIRGKNKFRAHLRKHAEINSGIKYLCDLCGKSYISKNQLRRHKNVTHFRREEKTCEICGYVSKTSCYFKFHMKVHDKNGIIRKRKRTDAI